MKNLNVWKCDHCSLQNENKEEIAEHEKTCSFDPSRRVCWSCKHYSEGYPFGGFECAVEQKGGYDYYDGEVENCPSWELDE